MRWTTRIGTAWCTADLKPSNVMLTRDSVKLLDFGLAKLKERDDEAPIEATRSERLTEVGAIAGTVPYMAPEQIEGRDVDGRTDIFAFGVVLFEMLCGRRPFAGDSRASLMAAIVARGTAGVVVAAAAGAGLARAADPSLPGKRSRGSLADRAGHGGRVEVDRGGTAGRQHRRRSTRVGRAVPRCGAAPPEPP